MISLSALLVLFTEAACTVSRFYACDGSILFAELLHEDGSCIIVNVQQYSVVIPPSLEQPVTHVTRVSTSLSPKERFLFEALRLLERPAGVLGWVAWYETALYYTTGVYAMPVRGASLRIDLVYDVERFLRARKSVGTDLVCTERWVRDRVSVNESLVVIPFLFQRIVSLQQTATEARERWERAQRILATFRAIEAKIREELRELDSEESTSYEFSRSVYNLTRRRRLEKMSVALGNVLGPKVMGIVREAGECARTSLYLTWLCLARSEDICMQTESLLDFLSRE
jgi:hypothetical protein